METNLIKVGNSKGIYYSISVFKSSRVQQEIFLRIDNDQLIIQPITENPRANWEAQFAAANAQAGQEPLSPRYLGTKP